MSVSPLATVFNVQRFSIHDGPGIRTTVFFKGCPLRCRWCQNPEAMRPEAELAVYSERCKSSVGCIAQCDHGALSSGADGTVALDRAVCAEESDTAGCLASCAARCAHGALKPIGRRVGVDELLEEVARDRPFYASSGGGVTLSGGEPTVQMPFIARFVERCHLAGIRVALQTCGTFAWDQLRPLLGRLELIQFDLKVMDREEHRRMTGCTNGVILANARRLVQAGAPVVFRMPVVPRMTDSAANLHAVAAFLTELGVGRIHLLRAHGMGEVKKARVGWPAPAVRIDSAEAAKSLERAERMLRRANIDVVEVPI